MVMVYGLGYRTGRGAQKVEVGAGCRTTRNDLRAGMPYWAGCLSGAGMSNALSYGAGRT